MRRTQSTGLQRGSLRWAVGISAAAVVIALVGACSNSSHKGAASTTAGASSTAPGGGGAGAMVTVTETEFKIALSTTSFRPGTYTFVADDKGKVTHALEIDGPGIQGKATSTISSGQSTQLTVTLQKGTYELFCPVDDHKKLGMDTHITVS